MLTIKQVENAVTAARVNQELEGLQVSAGIQNIGRRFLRGEISGNKARERILHGIQRSRR
ncbi:hypothetical protein OpiT1DRAFT_04998 [Opitutaceae bacterium TAV1]|nr:hypothetical protein OpiT1DRAFT_04998 [Opitutaceae bacterium TAV1]